MPQGGLLVGLALLWAGASWAAEPAELARGKELFTKIQPACAVCHTLQAAGAGQRAVLDHPLVADEFPYLLWSATHDTRVRPEHLKMEWWGPGECAVYRRDDPMWDTLWPPASYNCRCHATPLSLEDAVSHGSHEAREWLRTGRPPITPAWAARPYPITPPPGWPTGGRVGAVV